MNSGGRREKGRVLLEEEHEHAEVCAGSMRLSGAFHVSVYLNHRTSGWGNKNYESTK